jgi:hypothetical protein
VLACSLNVSTDRWIVCGRCHDQFILKFENKNLRSVGLEIGRQKMTARSTRMQFPSNNKKAGSASQRSGSAKYSWYTHYRDALNPPLNTKLTSRVGVWR